MEYISEMSAMPDSNKGHIETMPRILSFRIRLFLYNSTFAFLSTLAGLSGS